MTTTELIATVAGQLLTGHQYVGLNDAETAVLSANRIVTAAHALTGQSKGNG